MATRHKSDITVGSFDYVVIGAGSAGCVVAARLSEGGRYTVLLLEAGGKDRSPWIHIPMGYAKLYTDARLNWCYTSEAEPALEGRRLYQPRGKVLGGTGSINGMIYTRGQAEDFESWRDAGCPGWGYSDVLAYFKKAEHQTRGEDPYHGVGGPIWVSDLDRHALADAFIEAAGSVGIPRNRDFNGAGQAGAGYVQVNTRNGRRSSSATAYLAPAAKRGNLRVETGAHVARILFDGGRATGVEYTKGEQPRIARCNGEVILCAGTFNSPKVLQLSGVGCPGRLSANGIPIVAGLPAVGEGLQDHFGVPLEYRCRQAITINDLANSTWRRAIAGMRYLMNRGGPMASNGNFANAFVTSNRSGDRPDLMITLQAWCTDAHLKPRPFSGLTIMVELLRPKATGSVRIRSRDPRTPPEIRFNFLTEEADRKVIAAGLRIARRIAAAPAMAAMIANPVEPYLGALDDEALSRVARAEGLSLLHPTSSCRMGSGSDAVVDASLRVRGVDRLRVADASIMPSIVSGNTNAATVMIAEKAADMIAHQH